MAANPNLVKRPLLVKGRKIVYGYNEDEIEALFLS
jgi:arsenate reductase-like glutaredoxin family protein